MPPQQTPNQPPIKSGPGGSLDPNYGFIFNGQQQPKRRFPFRLPGNNNLTRIAASVIIGGAVLGILIIVLSNLLGPNGVNTKEVSDVIARAQEISRVSDLVSQQSRDTNALNLAATTSTTLTSDEAQLMAYLSKYAHKKISSKDLNLYLNKKTDTQIQNENANNNLSPAYYAYLKEQLAEYQSSIKTAAQDNPQNINPILQTALNNAQVILSTQQLATAQ